MDTIFLTLNVLIIISNQVLKGFINECEPQTDMATLWLNRPSGANSVNIFIRNNFSPPAPRPVEDISCSVWRSVIVPTPLPLTGGNQKPKKNYIFYDFIYFLGRSCIWQLVWILKIFIYLAASFFMCPLAQYTKDKNNFISMSFILHHV